MSDAAWQELFRTLTAVGAAAVGALAGLAGAWLQNRSAERRQVVELHARQQEQHDASVRESFRPLFERMLEAAEATTLLLMPASQITPERWNGVGHLVVYLPDSIHEMLDRWLNETSWGKTGSDETEALRRVILQSIREWLDDFAGVLLGTDDDEDHAALDQQHDTDR